MSLFRAKRKVQLSQQHLESLINSTTNNITTNKEKATTPSPIKHKVGDDLQKEKPH